MRAQLRHAARHDPAGIGNDAQVLDGIDSSRPLVFSVICAAATSVFGPN